MNLKKHLKALVLNRFPIKNLLIDSLLTPIVESTYLNLKKYAQSDVISLQWPTCPPTVTLLSYSILCSVQCFIAKVEF